MDAIDVLCAQLTRDLFAIAKFLVKYAHCVPKKCPVTVAVCQFAMSI